MAEERFLSPEKQLLDIIEGSKPKAETSKPVISPASAQSQNYTIHQNTVRRSNLSLFSMGAWVGRFSFLKQRAKQLSKGGQLESEVVGLTNRILSVGIGLCLVYFLGDFSYSMLNLKKTPKLNLNVNIAPRSLSAQDDSVLRNISYYLEKVRQRDIFKIGSKPTQKKTLDELQVKIQEMTENLKLVGISWSDDPDAMIEDSKIKKTYIVKRGQDIQEMKVQAIFKDKVVLVYQGVEVEIR